MTSADAALNPPLISLIISATDAGEFFALLTRIETALAGVPHEIIAVYGDDAETLLAADAMPNRLPTLRLVHTGSAPAFATGARSASGDVIVDLAANDPIDLVPALAELIRRDQSAMAIASTPHGAGLLAILDFLLADVAGMQAPNPIAGFRAYSGHFLERQEIASNSRLAIRLELCVKAQLDHEHLSVLQSAVRRAIISPPASLGALWPWLREALLAPAVVYALWLIMTSIALAAIAFVPGPEWGRLVDVALPAAAVLTLTLAVRRVRGRVRIADGFYSLVLLNPLLYTREPGPYDPVLLIAGLLGVMAGVIIAMKRDGLRRYLAVAGLALILSALSSTFIMVLPAIVAWFAFAGYKLARSEVRRIRFHGYFVLACAETCMIVFGLACILDEPTTAPAKHDLFTTIVSFTEFPLLVLAIVMLALGWRPKRHGGGPVRVPPYFAGMLALLVGLLTMNASNFSAGTLTPPGADQTALILCLVYTVFALHGPRRLQWIVPPLLLATAAAYTLFHPGR